MAKELPPAVTRSRERVVIYLDRRVQLERETLDVLSQLLRPQEVIRQVFCAAVLGANRTGALSVQFGAGGLAAEGAPRATGDTSADEVSTASIASTAPEDIPLVPVINPSAAAEALGPKFAGITNIFGHQSKTVSGE
jgi:hypothetical protein